MTETETETEGEITALTNGLINVVLSSEGLRELAAQLISLSIIEPTPYGDSKTTIAGWNHPEVRLKTQSFTIRFFKQRPEQKHFD